MVAETAPARTAGDGARPSRWLGLTPALSAWLFLRVSGVTMLLLVLTHLLVMHYLNAPSATGTAFVLERWSSAFWLAFDGLLLVVALTHGLVGANNVAGDHLQGGGRRRATRLATIVLGLAFAGIGSAAIASFNPASVRAGQGALAGQMWIAEVIAGLLALFATVIYGGAIVGTLAVGLRRLRGLPFGPWALPGHWAWAAHRVSGLGILGFLLVHVLDVLLLPLAPDVYDRTIAAYATPYLIPMEVVLVAAVVYHALNGVRIVALEAWDVALGPRRGSLLAAVAVLTVVLVVPSLLVMLRPA